MLNPEDEQKSTYRYEKEALDTAKNSLEKMRLLEKQNAHKMRTIVLPNGAIVSHTSEEKLNEFKRVGKSIFNRF